MILRELRSEALALELHPRVTVVRGLDDAARAAVAAGVARALGGAATDVEVLADLGDQAVVLSPERAVDLGLAAASSLTVLNATDLPGARVADPTVPGAPGAGGAPAAADASALEARVAVAESALADSRAALEQAEEARRAAEEALEAADEAAAADAAEAGRVLQAAESRLVAAQSRAAAARRALVEAREARRKEREAREREAALERALVSDRASELQGQLVDLEAHRAELLARMGEVAESPDTGPVEEVLAGLDRLLAAEPRPFPRALELADRWADYGARLAELPRPPEPPEWLLTPALTALEEARQALASAEAGGLPLPVDRAQIDAVERAHREVLDAEQKAMRKATRQSRRRLELAQEAERRALEAVGVASYGEYLQRVVPALEETGEARLARARASVADAEAVLEELYGGQASSEWTALKQEGAAIRAEAVALLGAEPSDDELEDALRAYRRSVVESGSARAALAEALRAAGADVADDAEPEAVARSWLAAIAEVRAERGRLEAELAALQERMSAVEAELAERQADAFFGTGAGDDGLGEDRPGDDEASDAFPALQAAVMQADEAEREAQAAVVELQRRLAESESTIRRAELEAGAAAGRTAHEEARRRLEEAEEGLRAARAAAAEAAEAAAAAGRTAPAGLGPRPGEEGGVGAPAGEKTTVPPAPRPGLAVDVSGVRPLEAEVYVLTRLTALRSVARAGPLPLVIDDAFAGLPDVGVGRILALLARSSAVVQVVYLSDDDRVAAWARFLGPEQAAVRVVDEASG